LSRPRDAKTILIRGFEKLTEEGGGNVGGKALFGKERDTALFTLVRGKGARGESLQ